MYYDSEGQLIPFETLLAAQPLGTHVYVCGPSGMINHVIATAHSCGWPDSHIHWEQFSAPPVGDAFEVFLARSKISVHVPPDQSLLESIEGRRCGSAVSVPGRRLRLLAIRGCWSWTANSSTTITFCPKPTRQRRKSIMPCVSRARCTRLVS